MYLCMYVFMYVFILVQKEIASGKAHVAKFHHLPQQSSNNYTWYLIVIRERSLTKFLKIC